MRLPTQAFLPPVLACLAVAPLAAQVKLTAAPPTILPGEVAVLFAELTAPLPDASGPVAWDWELESTAASRWELTEPLGSLTAEPGGVCRYHAPEDPFPLGKRKVRVRASVRGRPELRADLEISISTNLSETLFDTIPHIREFLGVSNLRQPSMHLVAALDRCGSTWGAIRFGRIIRPAPWAWGRSLARRHGRCVSKQGLSGGWHGQALAPGWYEQ